MSLQPRQSFQQYYQTVLTNPKLAQDMKIPDASYFQNN